MVVSKATEFWRPKRFCESRVETGNIGIFKSKVGKSLRFCNTFVAIWIWNRVLLVPVNHTKGSVQSWYVCTYIIAPRIYSTLISPKKTGFCVVRGGFGWLMTHQCLRRAWGNPVTRPQFFEARGVGKISAWTWAKSTKNGNFFYPETNSKSPCKFDGFGRWFISFRLCSGAFAVSFREGNSKYFMAYLKEIRKKVHQQVFDEKCCSVVLQVFSKSILECWLFKIRPLGGSNCPKTGPKIYLSVKIQTPKGRWVQGLYKLIHGTCATYFYLGVSHLEDKISPKWSQSPDGWVI